MKFMLIVKSTPASEAGVLPPHDLLEAMGKFNQEMMDAGIFVDAAGLKPSSAGARVEFSGDKRIVIDGPFAETKEVIAGFWIVDVESKEAAIAWAKRSPHPHPGFDTHIEVRPFYEMSDFENLT